MDNCTQCGRKQLGGFSSTGLCNLCDPILKNLVQGAAQAVESIPVNELELEECERCGEEIDGEPQRYYLPGETTENVTHTSCVPAVAYVNAYAVSRHYGGPEEGGWWYNAGEPIASVPIAMDADPEPTIKALRSLLEPKLAHGDIYSVRGGVEVQIRIEDHLAELWPASKPRYE